MNAPTPGTTPAPAVPAAVRDRVHALDPDQLPAYLYDRTALRAHSAAVRAALPAPVELYYAAKANPEPEILAALGTYVDGYEVSSGGELAHVAAAVPGRPLAFGGPGKTPAEIAAGLRLGVRRWHVESPHELRLLADLAARPDAVGSTEDGADGADDRTAPRAEVLLRVNLPQADDALTGSALAMGGRPSPFGLDPEQAAAVVRLLTDGTLPHLRLRGVHAHLASGLDAPRLLAVAASVTEWAAGLAERHGVPLDEVVVGGGMAVDYAAPDTRFDWAAYGAGLARLARAHPGVTLRVEPGRALTAYCGWYATEVLDVKRSHGEEFAVVRGGTHHLRTPATKGHDQPCAVLRSPRPWPHPWERPTARGELVTMAGQLCTPKDVLARRVPAAGLRAGDRIAFALAGAYAWNISHHDFLMHPRPGFHFLP
ncbi:type III PLP-dependent enzyme [Streptomyces sp. Z26]|uniref:type III PLP-dependent enzyme n=1 Tax=Streptomyces sp. Z26 TaxID=2500177 RepID=UPI000EF17222|nr:type III PLP-dependent enzyme [Streptomyces sp. Z26]RLL65682.1 type III PLP-dependent enzyme [Streptomyces sp. Z26]